MFWKSLIVTAALAASTVNAHMHMMEPAALGGKENKNSGGSTDYNYDSPLSADGSDFPCKGHLNLLNGATGTPTADWTAGGKASVKISGGARHNGGSCQVSISEDKGKTWKVMKSYIGNCPAEGGGQLDFTVPKGVKEGTAVMAWSWFNKVGNREMYMNCAAVNVKGGDGSGISSLPDMFVANVGNGCSTKEGADVAFPNPGADVANSSSGTAPPVGSCGAAASGGSKSDSSSDSGSAAASPSAPAAAVPTTSAAASAGSGSGSGSGSAAATPTYDDGQYHPPGATSKAAAVPEASAPAKVDGTAAAPVPTKTGAAVKPSAPPAAGGAGGAGNYDIVMVVDGKTQSGKATLTQPTTAPSAGADSDAEAGEEQEDAEEDASSKYYTIKGRRVVKRSFRA